MTPITAALAVALLALAGAPWWIVAAFGVFSLGPYPILWLLRRHQT
jgi:hypothetical protein